MAGLNEKSAISRTDCFACAIMIVDTSIHNVVLPKDMEQDRVCQECGENFTRAESLGHWNCSFHPLPWDYERSVYPCCRGKGKPGCVPCDHKDRPGDGCLPRHYDGSTFQDKFPDLPIRYVDPLVFAMHDKTRKCADSSKISGGQIMVHHCDWVAKQAVMDKRVSTRQVIQQVLI